MFYERNANLRLCLRPIPLHRMNYTFTLAFCLVCFLCFSQDVVLFKPDSVRKEFEAVRVSNNLKIDGLLNDKEWLLAKPKSDFIEVDPRQGEIPRHRTEMRALFNQNYLYIGVFNYDTLGKKSIRVIDFKRDFNTRTSDFVEH